MEEYEVTFNDGFDVFTFLVAMSLSGGTTGTVIGQAFANRTSPNNNHPILELITFQLRIVSTAAGLVLLMTVFQRLLVNELLPAPD